LTRNLIWGLSETRNTKYKRPSSLGAVEGKEMGEEAGDRRFIGRARGEPREGIGH
jgi:hypothetical protein